MFKTTPNKVRHTIAEYVFNYLLQYYVTPRGNAVHGHSPKTFVFQSYLSSVLRSGKMEQHVVCLSKSASSASTKRSDIADMFLSQNPTRIPREYLYVDGPLLW